MTEGEAAVGQEAGIFDVLEGTPPTGVFPLNENHWSNVLAWLLSKQTNPATADVFLETLADRVQGRPLIPGPMAGLG